MGGYSIKEAVMAYMRSNQEGDMAVSVDESPDIIGVGRRDGKIVPIVRPGSTLTAEEIMAKAGIQEEGRPLRGRVRVLSPLRATILPSRWQKPPRRRQ